MGIDIRDSPFQIECVHCGECIDACDQILARLGKPGLIHYAWGEGGSVIETEKSWFRKLGIRDAKRVVVALVTLFYLSGLLTALSMRRAVLVQLAPERATLYRMGDDGMVYNRFRVKVSNRSGQAAAVTFTLEGLPGARLEFEANPVVVGPAATADRHFEVAAEKFPGSQEVNHFRITAKAAPGSEQDSFDETFLMPPERK
jgi:polyferredoxin